MELAPAQLKNWEWWEQNPMTYDWERTLRINSGTRERFEEILKGELFPIPRTRFKEALERTTPDSAAAFVLSRFGSMLVAEAMRDEN